MTFRTKFKTNLDPKILECFFTQILDRNSRGKNIQVIYEGISFADIYGYIYIDNVITLDCKLHDDEYSKKIYKTIMGGGIHIYFPRYLIAKTRVKLLSMELIFLDQMGREVRNAVS